MIVDEQNKLFYELAFDKEPIIKCGPHPTLPLPPNTTLKEGWIMPPAWKEWSAIHNQVKPGDVDKAAERFTNYHIINKVASRNWCATWKLWSYYEFAKKKCLTEKKKSTNASKQLCPSCRQKFKG